MAPSCIVGRPQRSLVRIPGSGCDRSLKPVCLEIAQITSFQMSDVIPRSQLPPPETAPSPNRSYNIFEGRPNPRPEPRFTRHLNAESESTSGATPVVNPIVSQAVSLLAPTGPSEQDANLRKKRALEEQDKIEANPSKKTNTGSADSNLDIRIRNIRVLMEKRQELTKENEELNMKISKFKELLTDRVKLNEFLIAMRGLKC